MTNPIVGIDLGGTNMQFGLVDHTNTIIARAKKKTNANDGFDAVINRLTNTINDLCTQANISISDLHAVGLGAPGALNYKTGHLYEAVNLRWNDVPLAQIVSDKLQGVPVCLENDVNVGLYGEYKLGAGENSPDLLGVWLGTGIGGALIINNDLYHGHHHTAGEIGQMTLFPSNLPGWTSFEQNCSRSSVVDTLKRLINANNPSIISKLTNGDLSKTKSKIIGQAYEAQDPLTLTVINKVAELVGTHIAGVVTLLSLPRVVLGGGLTEALGPSFTSLVEQHTHQHVFPAALQTVKIVHTLLNDDAGVLGAALLARQRT